MIKDYQLLIGLVIIAIVLMVDFKLGFKPEAEYSFKAECDLKESQLCPDSDNGMCQWDARNYCKKLGLPENP